MMNVVVICLYFTIFLIEAAGFFEFEMVTIIEASYSIQMCGLCAFLIANITSLERFIIPNNPCEGHFVNSNSIV